MKATEQKMRIRLHNFQCIKMYTANKYIFTKECLINKTVIYAAKFSFGILAVFSRFQYEIIKKKKKTFTSYNIVLCSQLPGSMDFQKFVYIRRNSCLVDK